MAEREDRMVADVWIGVGAIILPGVTRKSTCKMAVFVPHNLQLRSGPGRAGSRPCTVPNI